MQGTYIHPTAEVSKDARIGGNTRIWHYCYIREKASIGDNCILGKNVYIDHNVRIGSNVKIQNSCLIYFDAEIEDGVFIGPHVVLTNDKVPRAITPDGRIKSGTDWKSGKIHVKYGASIGAGSVILTDIAIGKFAMVGAGSVVTKDVPDYALVYGNPAIMKGYVCSCGSKITNVEEKENNRIFYCSNCNSNIEIKI